MKMNGNKTISEMSFNETLDVYYFWPWYTFYASLAAKGINGKYVMPIQRIILIYVAIQH